MRRSSRLFASCLRPPSLLSLGTHPGQLRNRFCLIPISNRCRLIGEKNEQVVDDLRQRLMPYVRRKTNARQKMRNSFGTASCTSAVPSATSAAGPTSWQLSDPLYRGIACMMLSYYLIGSRSEHVGLSLIECSANLTAPTTSPSSEVMRYTGSLQFIR